MRLSRGSWLSLGIMLGVLILFGTPVGYVWLGMSNSGGMGSMTAAVKLRAEVEAMPEPDQLFAKRDSGQFGIRLKNGDWVTGVAKDSHGLYSEWFGGGTVVLKDSRGRVRCFFGHVCGSLGALEGAADFDSLGVFDAKLTEHKFAELQWP